MRRGLSLLELLVALAIFSIILLVTAGFLASSQRAEQQQRASGLLAEDVRVAAVMLEREVYLSGYRASGQTALTLRDGDYDALTLRFWCEPGMELWCLPNDMGSYRTSGYRVSSAQRLLWGRCNPTAGVCELSDSHINGPLVERVEAFRIAYLHNGSWRRGPLNVTLNDQGEPSSAIEALAVYLRASDPTSRGAPPFRPGSTVSFPPGLSLATFGLSDAPLADGRTRLETLIIISTPNLN